jgi:hypothetical protein
LPTSGAWKYWWSIQAHLNPQKSHVAARPPDDCCPFLVPGNMAEMARKWRDLISNRKIRRAPVARWLIVSGWSYWSFTSDAARRARRRKPNFPRWRTQSQSHPGSPIMGQPTLTNT